MKKSLRLLLLFVLLALSNLCFSQAYVDFVSPPVNTTPPIKGKLTGVSDPTKYKVLMLVSGDLKIWHDKTHIMPSGAYNQGGQGIPISADGSFTCTNWQSVPLNPYELKTPYLGVWVVPTSFDASWAHYQVEGAPIPQMVLNVTLCYVVKDRNNNRILPTGGIPNAPSISITSPANNSAFTAGSNLVVTGTATETGKTITKVELFDETNKSLGLATGTNPWTFTWTNVPASSSHTIKAVATDNVSATASASITVLNPSAVNIAKNKPVTASSTESATYPASNAVDGNATTRWSSAFTDPQWISINLQAKYDISQVKLNWEAASAKAFQIQVSNDNVNWATVYTTTTGAGGIQTLNVSGTGTYIRMYGTARNTAYGYSLFEFEVYGTLATTAPAASVTVTPAASTIIAGNTQQFTAVVKDQAGNVLSLTPIWTATGGTISSTGLFTGSTAGTYTVTASSETVSGTASVTVSPLVLTTLELTPATSTINVGGTQQFTVVGKDQLGNVMVITPTWATTGGSISATGLFTGLTDGTYTVTASAGTLSATATVTVNIVTTDPLTASYFQIVNKWTADYMRPTDGLATAAITQYESATVPTMSSFQWEFRTATTAGYYYIINRWTGNAIQPTGASVAENAGLSQVALTTANQNNTELQWAITASDEAGFYWIKNRKSGLSIRPTNGTNGTGVAIVQNALNTTYSSFKWGFANQTLKSAIIDGAEISGQAFKIYPNPATDKLNVEMKSANFTQLNIYTVSGMKVYSQSVSGMQRVRVDLTSYKKGMYFISLSGDGIQSERFVVK
jgi:hypothetical protein